MPAKYVLCIGEALVDVVIRGEESVEKVGGSPLNVAGVLASLKQPTKLAAWWGKDSRGALIEEYAQAHDLGIVGGSAAAPRTSVAYARLDEHGHATYEFDLDWDLPQLPDSSSIAHLHTGSIAATLEPGGSKVLATLDAMAGRCTISYDPNARPAIMGSPETTRERVEEIIARCDVVKASDEDVAWLYPGSDPIDVMRRWQELGATLVVVTRGDSGAYARLRHERDTLAVSPMYVHVVDTVGAGDSFMGGLLSALLDAGLLGSADAQGRLREARWADVIPALHRATITSSITVSHEGAYAPRPTEVIEVLDNDRSLRY